MKVAIGAILKNEAPYILEWVAFHRAVGVTGFFIADNASDDGTTELLAALASVDLIHHLPFPNKPEEAPQLPAYSELMSRHGGDADWIAFIDGDEFLVPQGGETSILSVLGRVGDDVGAIAVNWAVFGSSFQSSASRGLVVERFTRRAEEGSRLNFHYKSIIRPSAFAGLPNPHAFRLSEGYHYVHADMTPLVQHSQYGIGLSEEIRWSPLRVNHYVVKSRAEFEQKRARGRATTELKRNNQFFQHHDRNDVEELMPADLVDATKREMQRLRSILRAAGYSESLIMVDETILGPKPDSSRERGVIDKAFVEGDVLTVMGWAIDEQYRQWSSLGLRINDYRIEAPDIKRIQRGDVARHFPRADLKSGFLISISISGLPEELRSADSLKLVVDAGRSWTVSKTLDWTKRTPV